VEFRPAAPADWPAVWAFLQPVLAAGETYTYPRGIGEADAEVAWFVAPPWRAVVALDAARPVAIAKYGPNHPGAGAHVANASFVVDPAASGRGIGRALAEHVLAAAAADGFRAMQFNAVVATNVGAVALWASLGFTTLATVPEAFDHPTEGLVGLHLMHRFL
jgi:GNAT superfamily N-acetyltransferase